jgi:hypothetical protein
MKRLVLIFSLIALGWLTPVSAQEADLLGQLGLAEIEVVDPHEAAGVRGQGFATPGLTHWIRSSSGHHHQLLLPYGRSYSLYRSHGPHAENPVLALGKWYALATSDLASIKSDMDLSVGHQHDRPIHFWNGTHPTPPLVHMNFSSHVTLSVSAK